MTAQPPQSSSGAAPVEAHTPWHLRVCAWLSAGRLGEFCGIGKSSSGFRLISGKT